MHSKRQIARSFALRRSTCARDVRRLERSPREVNRLGFPNTRREKEAAGMALFEALRKRVVEAGAGRHVTQRGGQVIRGQHRQRRALVAAVPSDGRDFPGSNGRGPPLGPHRGAWRLSVGA
jgi:hypothetical protein